MNGNSVQTQFYNQNKWFVLLFLYFVGISKKNILEEIKSGYRMPAPSKCPQFIYKIMQSCWSEQSEDRPNFKWLKSELQEYINRAI